MRTCQAQYRAALDLLFEPLGEPLLDHALVIEVAGAGDALDAREHAGIEAHRDGGRVAIVGLDSEAFISRMSSCDGAPERGLVLLGLEARHLGPTGDGFEPSHLFRSSFDHKKNVFLGHFAGKDDPVFFSPRNINS